MVWLGYGVKRGRGGGVVPHMARGGRNTLREAGTDLFRLPVARQGREHRALEMKTLLLGVTLSLAAVSFSLKEEDITGTWYVKAVVTDKDLPEEKRPRRVSPVTVTALDHGDLEATFTFMRNDRCFQKKILMRKTEEPGKFSTCEPLPAPLQRESTRLPFCQGPDSDHL
ncbi:hypothetical protein P7K49_001909 [Saguinus oedipus]|uniref:Lipocalin/cytosolic fatty-acid binding domain-containing protein n=1 Tax=Saguinus oedipus TaxID=9490 RepID=A0ABQ9WFV1_SAGOE|nr:hypothetical protein P7K49_001909 [Saguinus oedipus]